jgi:hypothetical protein
MAEATSSPTPGDHGGHPHHIHPHLILTARR